MSFTWPKRNVRERVRMSQVFVVCDWLIRVGCETAQFQFISCFNWIGIVCLVLWVCSVGVCVRERERGQGEEQTYTYNENVPYGNRNEWMNECVNKLASNMSTSSWNESENFSSLRWSFSQKHTLHTKGHSHFVSGKCVPKIRFDLYTTAKVKATNRWKWQ